MVIIYILIFSALFFVWYFISSFQRKMLALYLHHDSSVLTNVFCTQSLCSDSVCGFLNENFVTFGWDVTFSSNKTRAVNMITKHFGSVAASTLKNMDIERLPVLVLITKLRGSMEILQVYILYYYNMYINPYVIIISTLIHFDEKSWFMVFFHEEKKV